MAYINLSAAAKAARSAALNNAIGNNPTITVYAGTAPATPDDVPESDALVTISISGPFGVSAEGVLTASVTGAVPATATATGVAGWARIAAETGSGVIDLDVGVANASVLLNTLSVVTGGPVQITGLTISEA